jgi:hypothetical protein
MLKSFHKFAINEKENPREGGSSMRRGKKDIDQDSPSKSGIEYKKNISYKKSDTGITSANSYLIFLKEAISAIDEMTSVVSLVDPEAAKYANKKKIELGSNLEAKLDSHLSMWEGLLDLADYLYENRPRNNSSDDIAKSYQESLDKLNKDFKNGNIEKGDYEQKKADLKKSAEEDINKAQDIYYQKMDEALPFFKEAISTFKKGASVEIRNIDKEEAKSDDIESEDNFTDWLEQATKISIKTLYKNK